ncbi:MAG: outer membrane protein assembly factor BamB family protein [Acidobacteriota bacterium]
MTIADTNAFTARKPLRLWPGVVLAVLLAVMRYVLPVIAPDAMVLGMPLAMLGVVAGVAGALAIVLWWLLASRAPWIERISALFLLAGALLVTSRVVHPSIANGMMGLMLPFFAIPVLALVLVAWAVATHRLADGLRRASMVGAILVACGGFTLIRTGGVSGEGTSDLHWRWTPTPEDRLLAQAADEPAALTRVESAASPSTEAGGRPAEGPRPGPADSTPTGSRPAPVATSPSESRVAAPADNESPVRVGEPAAETTTAEWPGFRGPARDGIVRGVRIVTDWTESPPVELWRRPIGPGWSSFAVHGDLVYTQEQRGDEEMVSCYRLSTGEPVWMHRDRVRFWESNGGAGPRATPTLSNGRIYTFGATGIVNALDATNGAVAWSRNAATDTGVKVPDWGFAGSPLVTSRLVVVAVAGQLVAYDVATGDRRWSGPAGGAGYSSPHLVTIDAVDQVLLLRGSRTISVAPADGTVLWEHVWQPSASIVQPALAPGGGVLLATGDAMGGLGIRRIAVARGPEGWKVEERWTSRGLKPYFNDMVVHNGHAYGFDGSILASIDLGDGTRKWKGGRYGHGQMVLLPEQDLLLVLSEDGDIALVAATPDKYTEVARVSVLNGKTWNHPVVVGDVLLVRNGEEMAAFRLKLDERVLSPRPVSGR